MAAKTQISDDAVKKATGRDWAEWFKIFDKAKADKKTHQEITAIAGEHGAPPWWSQMVTVQYERERGLREVHQKSDGYSVSVSRTVAAPVAELYDAWDDGRRRAKWLKQSKLTIRKATPNKSMRITWNDGETSVEVGFYAKGAGKSQVAVQHSKLKDKNEVAAKKELWSEALGRLKEQLE